jgi:hypothetical protein
MITGENMPKDTVKETASSHSRLEHSASKREA